MKIDMTINLVDVLIAIFGLVISIIQIIDLYRKKKHDDAVKKTTRTLGEMATNINDFENFNSGFSQIVDKNRKELVERLTALIKEGKSDSEQSVVEFRVISNFYNEMLQMMNKYKAVNKMYQILLESEESFAISYGFNRYIDSFRNYINNPQVKLFNAICNLIEEDVNAFNASLENEEYKEKGLYPVQYKFLFFLIIKKGDESILDDFKEYEEFKQYAKKLYYGYWHLLSDEDFFDNLERAYDQIEPILNEMKIKFKKKETNNF